MSDYKGKTERIQELANNPQTLSAHIANSVGGLTNHLPNVSQSIGNNIVNSVQFLNSKIQKPVQQFPLSQKWEPSEAHIQKFNRYYDAVDNPLSALDQIKRGELTSETMESLQAVHPELLKQMQEKLIKQADPEKEKNLPYHVKQSLSMFLGSPLDESFYQPVRQSNQIALQGAAQQKAQDQAAMMGKTTQKGLEKLNFSERAATETARDESAKE